jgi:ResB-like family
LPAPKNPILKVLTSLQLTIVCLSALMILVMASTLTQGDMGLLGAVNKYMRSFVVWWQVPGTQWMIPIFPGGATVGIVLIANLLAAQISRIELSWSKAGLWIVHFGLILFVAGEFVSSVFQVESQMAIENGQTVNFIEGRDPELAVIDVTDPAIEEVYAIRMGTLRREGTVTIPGTPLTVKVHDFVQNSQLRNRTPFDPPARATAGVGASVTLVELPPVTADNQVDVSSALVEPIAGGRSYGTWLVSQALGAPQTFTHEGRTYRLEMRNRRQYLPYAVTLKKFSHDKYAGTEIPKNFSSLVHLSNPGTGEERDVLIYMNQPLRYDGKAFYQASFGKGDTLSILQVVENPGWLLPYVSMVLVTVGLLIHFGISLRRSSKKREKARLEQAAQEA